MMKKLTYTNRKGTTYHFREVEGKRGKRIACSQSETEHSLAAIPDTHEIVESANGQVSCRKKMITALGEQEIQLAKMLCPKLTKKEVYVFVEIKKKAIILHSADAEGINEMAKLCIRLGNDPRDAQLIKERTLRYEATLKLELTNKESREFSIERKTWSGTCGWMFINSGPLEKLLKKYVPHLEQESFFELY